MNAQSAGRSAGPKEQAIIVREWDNDRFHLQVLEWEAQGYVARHETYTVTPEQHPETGYIIHLYCMEMYLPTEFPQ